MARNSCSSSKISIWWDIENCNVPRNVDPHYIALNLRSALHHSDLNGPITIDVFGDTKNLDHKMLEALSSTGITINHIPSGNKDAADKAILVAMLFWALDNPPPAHFLLISGDGDFANALHRLRLKGYDILLARPDQQVKPALLGAATSVWYWTNVARGQNSQPEGNKAANKDSFGRTARPSCGPDDNVQNVFCRTFPLQQSDSKDMTGFKVARTHDIRSERSSLSEKDIAPRIYAFSEVSEYHSNRNVSLENVKPIGGAAQCELDLEAQRAKLMPANQNFTIVNTAKQLHSLGQHPSLSGSGGTFARQQSYEGHASSNKIREFSSNGPPKTLPSMPWISGHLERLPQDTQQTFASNLSKVMRTFETLKIDGLVPTLENLQDCLCYWDKRNEKVDLKPILDIAMNLGHVEKLSGVLRGNTVFIPIKTELWRCYNVDDMAYTFSNAVSVDFCLFLRCSKNWQFFVHSRSMYEAAQRLKHDGPTEVRKLALGEIICFLNQAIRKWKWLSHQSTPTFMLSIQSKAVFVEGPNQEGLDILSTPSHPQKIVPTDTMSGHTTKFSVDKTSDILTRFRDWLKETAESRKEYEMSQVPKDFLLATGIQLDIKKLGFSRLQKLLEKFSDVVTIVVGKKGVKILRPVASGPERKQQIGVLSAHQDKQQNGLPRPSSGVDLKPPLGSMGPDQPVKVACTEPVQGSSDSPASKEHPLMKRLRNWLLELPNLKEGYDLSLVKRDFHQATGMMLDPPSLGYSKVKDIVNIFPEDFRVVCPRPGGMALLFSNSKIVPLSKSNAGANRNNKGENLENLSSERTCSQPKSKTESMQRKELDSSVRTMDGKTSGLVKTMEEALFASGLTSQLACPDGLSSNDQSIEEEVDKDSDLK